MCKDEEQKQESCESGCPECHCFNAQTTEEIPIITLGFEGEITLRIRSDISPKISDEEIQQILNMAEILLKRELAKIEAILSTSICD